MGQRCLKCFRPVKNCYCTDITPVDPGCKFLILMHPHEAYQQKTGTGRLTALSLINSEIVVDKSFDNNRRVSELLKDPRFHPVLLYPGEEAHPAETFDFTGRAEGRRLLIILIDGTWRMAKKMLFHSKSLQTLPRITFSGRYLSRFHIKTQPEAHCLSTIESTYYLIQELQKSGICDPGAPIEGLLKVFDKMVKFQMDCRVERIGYPEEA